MAQPVKDSFLDLERHRQLLEENIEKLRKSLRHWQIWEAEYEGLKEEILSLQPTPNHDQLVAISESYEGELVTKKEIEDILGLKTTRDAAQVVNILDRRIDYVEQNVRTFQKQIDAAEEKLATATIISRPDVRNEEGLPMTEIFEELDDDGNVVSSRLSTPASAKPQLLEVLEKAGIKDLPTDESTIVAPAKAQEPPQPNAPKTSRDPQNLAAKKSVKFTETTKSEPLDVTTRKSPVATSSNAKLIEEIVKRGNDNAKITETPVIPMDESPEDAALRKQMLQYGMSEVGAVVAELDFEEGSDWSGEDYDDGESDSDEDEYGRSTRSVIDDELRERMIELEKRLGARMMENVGNKDNYDIVKEGIGRITVNSSEDAPEQVKSTPKSAMAFAHDARNDTATTVKTPSTKPAKKSVKFSEELDIAPAPTPPADPPSTVPPSTVPKVAPIGDIIERKGSSEATAPFTQSKPSRFKAARAANPKVINGPLALSNGSSSGPSIKLQPAKPATPKPFSTPITFNPMIDDTRTVPTGPEGKIIAPTVVERDMPTNPNVPEPDEMDPQLLGQEVATEYHKMRNRMIQRQGGFMKEDESEIVPFSEEEGGPKKLSRFMAARLAKSS